MSAASEGPTPEHPSQRLRRLVAALVAIEAILLAVGSVVLVVEVIRSDGDNAAPAISLAAIAVVVAVGLAMCARGIVQGLRWTRGPVLTWQLLQAGVGMPVSTSGAWWAGVPLLAVSIVVGVLMVGRQVIQEASGPASDAG
jgi:hypothetical protein